MLWSKRRGHNTIMAGCFDIRSRTNSLDLQSLVTTGTKLSRLSRLFRSKSDSSVKDSSKSEFRVSPKTSPKEAVPRRRFMRVVRDGEKRGQEYENPHIIRKYNPGYWEQNFLDRSQSLDTVGDSEVRPLPYTVSGNTILKKHASLDSDSSCGKHASFKEEVEVVEYDRKGKCLYILDDSEIVKIKLHDSFSEEEESCSETSSLSGVPDDTSSESGVQDDADSRDSLFGGSSSEALNSIAESPHEVMESPVEEVRLFVPHRDDSDIQEEVAPKKSKIDSMDNDSLRCAVSNSTTEEEGASVLSREA